jgi:tripartite-type tricarboxylate transporter receptor subunit TctC
MLAGLAVAVSAQTPYPSKPIRLIIPYPAGSATDLTARDIGQLFSKSLGQPVVVDPRPGAGATLSHNLVAKSQPDGYTLLFATTGGLVSGPALMGSRVPYDPLKDFAPIGLINYVPYGIVVTPSLSVNNIKELIDLAKAQPGRLNVASPGVGTPNHLGAAQLMTMTGIELVHVPYKGGSQALTDLIAGTVQITVTALQPVLPSHQTGRLRILGVGHMQRLKAYPDIPTIAETVPGYYNTGWWGIAAPAGTPKAIVDRLNSIMNTGLKLPETVQRFEKNGLEVAPTTPQGFQDLIRSDLQMWNKLLTDAKISVDSLP